MIIFQILKIHIWWIYLEHLDNECEKNMSYLTIEQIGFADRMWREKKKWQIEYEPWLMLYGLD